MLIFTNKELSDKKKIVQGIFFKNKSRQTLIEIQKRLNVHKFYVVVDEGFKVFGGLEFNRGEYIAITHKAGRFSTFVDGKKVEFVSDFKFWYPIESSLIKKPQLTLIHGGNYDDLAWLRIRISKNKKNEDRIRAERAKGNKSIIKTLDKNRK